MMNRMAARGKHIDCVSNLPPQGARLLCSGTDKLRLPAVLRVKIWKAQKDTILGSVLITIPRTRLGVATIVRMHGVLMISPVGRWVTRAVHKKSE